MKKYLMIILILFISGCSSQYTLNIDGENIEENINFTVDKEKFVEEELAPDQGIYSSSTLDYLKNSDIKALYNEDKYKFEKNLNDDGNILQVELNYKYLENQLEDSNFLNSCFENKEIIEENDSIKIHLTGKFYCLGENSDAMEFVISTKNKVDHANIDYNIFDNKFTWYIDGTNKDNVGIEIEILKKSKLSYYGTIAIVSIAILGVIILTMVAVAKISNRKNVNEI